MMATTEDENFDFNDVEFVSIFRRYQQWISKPVSRTESGVSPEVAAFCSRTFDKNDVDKNGILTIGELKMILEDLGIDRMYAETGHSFDKLITTGFNAYDSESKGHITRVEFECLFDRLQRQFPELRAAIPDLEKERREELRRKTSAREHLDSQVKDFKTLKLDKDCMKRIFELFDADRSGYLDVDEIVTIVRQMNITDYERDGYKGFIERNCSVIRNGESQGIEFPEFCELLQSLVTSKVDRDYRQNVLGSKPKPKKNVRRSTIHFGQF